MLADDKKAASKTTGAARRARVFCALFCGVLGLAFPMFNLFSSQLSMDNHENRLLTGLPQLLSSPLNQLPANLDAFMVDNSPFRYQLVLLDASIDYTLFGTSQSDQVLPGKDGWLFYKDGPTPAQPMANYQGLTAINDTDAALADTAAALTRLRDTLAGQGCTLIFNLTPSKDRVYREYMPDGYPIVNAENRTDRFAAYLRQNTDLTVVYSADTLRAAALADPAQRYYFKTDTHWNHAGALLGLDDVLGAAGLETPEFSGCDFAVSGRQTGDMANVAALYAILPAEDDYAPAAYDFSPDARTVGVVGDSFSEYYMPYLERRFAASWRQPLDGLSPALAADPGADLLILEVNERSISALQQLLAAF